MPRNASASTTRRIIMARSLDFRVPRVYGCMTPARSVLPHPRRVKVGYLREHVVERAGRLSDRYHLSDHSREHLGLHERFGKRLALAEAHAGPHDGLFAYDIARCLRDYLQTFEYRHAAW